MSDLLPKALQDLIESLSRLPGIGSRTAERYALNIFKLGSDYAEGLASNLMGLSSGVVYCPKTKVLIDADEKISNLYTDENRDKKTIMVLAEPLDIIPFENTKVFKGTYLVLGGLLSPVDGMGPESLEIGLLKERIEADNVSEIIIATNASVEGEATALWLQNELKIYEDIKVSRLARGLPAGVDIEFTDQLTLTRALNERNVV